MDYEKAYKEALERAVEFHKDTDRHLKATIERIFPELRESEDERIRKEIVNFILYKVGHLLDEKTEHKFVSYLEKQKEHFRDVTKMVEQKPAEWNDTDMKEARDNLISVCRDWERGERTTLLPIVAARARYFLEHLTEPKPAMWSEGDEKMLRTIISDGSRGVELDSKQIAFLKSLRPQYHGNVTMTEAYKMGLEAGKASFWKPSEEQMIALYNMIPFVNSVGVPSEAVKPLESLYEDLKKL